MLDYAKVAVRVVTYPVRSAPVKGAARGVVHSVR